MSQASTQPSVPQAVKPASFAGLFFSTLVIAIVILLLNVLAVQSYHQPVASKTIEVFYLDLRSFCKLGSFNVILFLWRSILIERAI